MMNFQCSMLDEYHNDDRIVQPCIEHFQKNGRSSTPLQVYIRMMFIQKNEFLKLRQFRKTSFW